MNIKSVIVVCLVNLFYWNSVKGQAPNKIQINSASQWQTWKYPKDCVSIEDNGVSIIKRVYKNIDAVSDARKFSRRIGDPYTSKEYTNGGIRDAGSNLKDAPNVMDGDMNSFWEPNRNDHLEKWWIDLDLGRLVIATKIVVKFVEEGKGDTFLSFSLLTSSGMRTYFADYYAPLYYMTIAQDFEPKGQRTVEFDMAHRTQIESLSPFSQTSIPSSPGTIDKSWIGLPVQYVRIRVTASKFGKAELLSKAEYLSLPEEERGDVQYFRITATGKEKQINREGYEKLPLEARGPIKYYRRELPRLAEVEVWSIGDNLALGLLDRGGSVEVPKPGRFPYYGEMAVDGSILSYAAVYYYWPEGKRDGAVFDLGAAFWVEGVCALDYLGSGGYKLFLASPKISEIL